MLAEEDGRVKAGGWMAREGTAMKWLIRTGGILVAPRRTFRHILHGQEGGVGDILLLMFLVMLGTAPVESAAIVLGAERGLGSALARLLGMYVHFALTPLLVCVAVALVLVGAERLRGRRVSVEGAVSSCAYLWIPVGMLALLGSILRLLGLDLWLLPHVPLGFFIRAMPPWWMYLLRAVVVLGWSGYLLWILVGVIREEKVRKLRPVPGMARWVLVGWVLLSYAAAAMYVGRNYHQIRPLRAGDRAPDFTLPRADGMGRLTLSSQAGKPVVVEFWADWCSKCITHMPALQAWARTHPDVPVLAIHQGGDMEGVHAFVSERRWKGPVYLVDGQGEASAAYRVDTLPTFVVVHPDGRVAAIRLGAPPQGWLEQAAGLSGE
jgi:thiol-disulfide isomerase/thioredoxin